MRFSSLNATFGKLERREVCFSEGLNILEAPNEAGKSTLCAFLRVMLYGLSTRERGAAADKNLYAPWSGSPMQGRLDLITDDGYAITLTRDTARANAPMGRFSAVYTGTGESIPDLTAANCGEQLLGVSREVYERSAFIRQSGLAVTANAELERRIASLITTGEEGSSYTETEAVLRRQLNARRHNKTGLLPTLDAELTALEDTAAELRSLTAEHREAEDRVTDCTTRANALREALHRHDLADAQERALSRADAKAALERAEAETERAQRALLENHIPSRATLEQARAQLTSLPPLEAAAERAEALRSDAEAKLSTFDATAKSSSGTLLYIAAALLFAVLSVTLLLSHIPSSSLRYVSLIFSLAASALFSNKAFLAQKKTKNRAQTRTTLETAVREAQATAAAQRSLYERAQGELLSLLPIESPAHSADYLRFALARHDEIDALMRAAQTARVRCEALAAQSNDIPLPAEPVERPTESRAALQSALADCEAEMREAQRRIDYTAGRSRALGDLADTESLLAEKRAEREQIQAEYDALVLALDTLARANSVLQSRFSPALGQRAAELLGRMTDGRYRSVLLDRSFNASVETADEPIAHELLSLSQGAADQLYLAVRLAICETVLPTDRFVPLVLDDALTNFDDARCAAALELLLEESRSRQILLLTCQHREAEYLADREGVHVMTL